MTSRKNFLFVVRFLFLAIGGLLLVSLFWHTSEVQSQFFLGYSKTRWLTGIYTLGMLLVFTIITGKKLTNLRDTFLLKNQWGKILFLLYSLILLGSILYFLYSKNPYLGQVIWVLIWSLFGVGVIIGYWHKSFFETIKKIENLQVFPNKSSLVISVILALVWGMLSLYLFFYGQPNADEGWYLFASKLVYKGYIPYRDFAYTQMPLLPYIYGIPQLIYPSFVTGRLTSFFFSIVSYLAALSIAKKVSGENGKMAVQIMLLLYPTVAFFGIAVKTYTLISSFMLITLFFIIQDKRNSSYYALIASIVPGFVRLSALPFSIMMVIYILFMVKRKTPSKFYKHLILLLITCFPMIFLMGINVDATIWNIFSFHMNSGNQVTSIRELAFLFWDRLPKLWEIWSYFGKITLLSLFPAIIVLFKKTERKLPHQNEILSMLYFGLAVLSFSIFNLVSGIFLHEYLIPSFIPLIIIFGTLSAFIFQLWQPTKIYRFTPHLLLLILLFKSIPSTLEYITYYAEKCNSCNVIIDVNYVGDVVKKYSEPSENVFALSNLFVAVEADRDVSLIFSMAQFSITGLDDVQSNFFKVVNSKLLFEYLEETQPQLLILSLSEKEMLENNLSNAFINSYSTEFFLKQFGQKATPLYILVRNE